MTPGQTTESSPPICAFMVAVSSHNCITTSNATIQKMPAKIVSFWRRVIFGFTSNSLRLNRSRFKPDREHDSVLDVQFYQRQRSARRTSDWSPLGQFKVPVVARTV